jgi:quercetin dioxygenase-like cupin family protein
MSEAKDSQKLTSAEAMVLKDLVEYQEGAVVSRTITKGPAGTLTLFAFAQGQELSEHSTPFDAYVHVLDGVAELRIGGQDVAAHAGQLVFMPADVPHAVRAIERFKMLLAMFKQRD